MMLKFRPMTPEEIAASDADVAIKLRPMTPASVRREHFKRKAAAEKPKPRKRTRKSP